MKIDSLVRRSMILPVLFYCILLLSSCGTANDNLSEQEYRDACRSIPVSELTENADGLKDELIAVTGEVVVFFEESDDDGRITSLVIGVEDEAGTLPGGQLPVYISIRGSTAAFINDNITVYGEVYGNDTCPSPQIDATELPRIDARYIDLE